MRTPTTSRSSARAPNRSHGEWRRPSPRQPPADRLSTPGRAALCIGPTESPPPAAANGGLIMPMQYLHTMVRISDVDASLRFYCNLRSEEHTSELQSLMRISYAVFCLNKKKVTTQHSDNQQR